MAFVVLEVIVGKEDLGNMQAESRKELFVSGHQARLADGGACLQLRKRSGPFVVTERTHACPYRARSHEDDFLSGTPLRRDLSDQLLRLCKFKLLTAIGQDTGSQLDHEAADVVEQFPVHSGVGSKDARKSRGSLSARSLPACSILRDS